MTMGTNIQTCKNLTWRACFVSYGQLHVAMSCTTAGYSRILTGEGIAYVRKYHTGVAMVQK